MVVAVAAAGAIARVVAAMEAVMVVVAVVMPRGGSLPGRESPLPSTD